MLALVCRAPCATAAARRVPGARFLSAAAAPRAKTATTNPCFVCGQAGHWANERPLNSGVRSAASAVGHASPNAANPKACFVCGEEGHWASACPNRPAGGAKKWAEKSGGGRTNAPPKEVGPVPQCQCGNLAVERTVNKEDSPNVGRQFFACDGPKDLGCDFFQWVGDGPVCRCGTNSVKHFVKKEGRNAGRPMFTCANRRFDPETGQSSGGCNYFEWGDQTPSVAPAV